VEEMNETIIKRHNERVTNDDWVFFLGDFCFKNTLNGKKGEGLPVKAIDLRKRLNGNFIFIGGNHDRNNSLKTIIQRLVISYGNHRINLVHKPDFVDFNYKINLVGHVHDRWKIKRIEKNGQVTDAINMSCEVWDYYPRTFEEIYSRYKKWLKIVNTGSLNSNK